MNTSMPSPSCASPAFRRFAASLSLILILLLFGCGGQARRTGEIGLHKITPQNPLLGPDPTKGVFMLNNRGFNASENASAINDCFGSTKFLGITALRQTAHKLLVEAARKSLRMKLDNEYEHLAIRTNLETIQASLAGILQELEALETNGYNVQVESNITLVAILLYENNCYLENVQSTTRQMSETLRRNPADVTNPNLLFSVFGETFIPGVDWTKIPYPGTNYPWRMGKLEPAGLPAFPTNFLWMIPGRETRPDQCPKAVLLFTNRIHSAFAQVEKKLVNARIGPVFEDLTNSLHKLEALESVLSENLLNLAHATDFYLGQPRGPRKAWMRSTSDEAFRNQYPPSPMPAHIFQLVDLKYVIANINQAADKSQRETMQFQNLLNRAFASAFTNASERMKFELIKARLEEYAQSMLRMTEHDFFHRLAVKKNGDSDAFVTIMLKTLYLRYLGDPCLGSVNKNPASRDTDLLVNVMVQSQGASSITYPVLFERHYAPGHFVNRVDRFLFGPSPYQGDAIDIRFQVLCLNDLNNESIVNGFSSISGIIGAANPEYAAISPIVNQLFAGILNSTTQPDTELDFSFTIPQPEGEGKSDADFLVAETGHYILIKKENATRRQYNAFPSIRRDYYRDLIYNSSDGKLYHRKNISDPESNFTEDNLFLEQSYAVLVVTDEYTKEDKLGETLRAQVAKSLGEARARKYIPDGKEVRDVLNLVRTVRNETAEKFAPNLAAVQQLKQELWNPASNMRQQFIVETLYDLADAKTKLILGNDPDKWKRAVITTNANALTVVDNAGPGKAP